jgi:serine/threonine protein kinase
VGTPSYMSPEQIQGQKVDRRADIWAAGVILYQFLTWQKPFEGTQWVLASKIVQEDPVWPSQLMQVSQEFDRLVARALAKDLDQRYQTARQFSNALKRVFSGKPAEDPADGLPPLASAAAPAAAEEVKVSEAEKEFWNEVKDSEEPEDVELYLEQFPRGVFAQQARDKLAALKK